MLFRACVDAVCVAIILGGACLLGCVIANAGARDWNGDE